jgi:hypothetical protein
VLNQLSTRTILPLEDIYIFFRDDPWEAMLLTLKWLL